MSYYFQKRGTPAQVVDALHKFSDTLGDQSKEEFENAKPNLVGLVDLNKEQEEDHCQVELTASGHGVKDKDGVFIQNRCVVKLDRV